MQLSRENGRRLKQIKCLMLDDSVELEMVSDGGWERRRKEREREIA